ncbi:MAG: transposase [Streptococcaceae bacterium]|nr:transposase [Streptococcaceae bacterium]
MGKTRPIDSSVKLFFADPVQPLHRQYLALRSFYFEEKSAVEVAAQYGYTVQAVYTLAKNFRNRLESSKTSGAELFFQELKLGRPKQERDSNLVEIIVNFRKKQLSVPDIKILLDSKGYNVTEGLVYRVCDENGFARLPKRSSEQRQELMERSGYVDVIQAAISTRYPFIEEEQFSSKGVGVLTFLPLIKKYKIDKVIQKSSYPKTKKIGRLSSILAFLALKLSNVQRYGQDDGWCMDRGLGMFAGLNVLPKTTWYSAYSDAIERKDNVAFLKSMNRIFADHGLLSDTANLDFTAIPYWGDEDPFENNWSGKRSKALISIQAALAQDPDTGILCYGDTTVKHDNQDDVVLEFLDFYQSGTGKKVNYLIFDSKFTTLENLGRINGHEINFITIQRKSKHLNEKIAQIPDAQWKTVKIEKPNHKSRTAVYSESTTTNKRYGDQPLRQIFIKGRSIKPATILTNDFELKAEEVIRRYSRRWLIENEISEQIHFFHLNRNCSGIVVKVDFDLTMTILAHNLYRLLAAELQGYSHNRAQSLYDKFIDNYGEVVVGEDEITVKMNRKRALPLLRESIPQLEDTYSWLGNKKLVFTANSHT